jgi:hypothetical protein
MEVVRACGIENEATNTDATDREDLGGGVRVSLIFAGHRLDLRSFVLDLAGPHNFHSGMGLDVLWPPFAQFLSRHAVLVYPTDCEDMTTHVCEWRPFHRARGLGLHFCGVDFDNG